MAATIPTYADFIARFPQFIEGVISEEAVTLQIELSSNLLCPDAWGDFYSEGILYETAHNIAMDVQMNSDPLGGQQAAAGTISSSSGAGLSVSFESSRYQGTSATDNWYMKTGFGQKFLNLRNTIIPKGVMAI